MVILLKKMVEPMSKQLLFHRFSPNFLFHLSIILFFSLFLSSFSVLAYETPRCAYGTFDAWFSLDGVHWYNTTLEDIELTRGEPFFVKTVMRTSEPFVRVGMMFTEPGEYTSLDSTFEIINGPTSMFDPFIYGVIEEPYHSFEHIWMFQVKNQTEWVQATAPLNVFVQFDHKEQDAWSSEEISFTVVYPFILDECYTGKQYGEQQNTVDSSKTLPVQGIIFVSISLVLLAIVRKKLLF